MKFTFVATLISAAAAASLPLCPLPENAPPAASTPAAPPAPSAPAGDSSSDYKVGDAVGIIATHSGSDVHLQPIGINTDNKLGIHATSGDISYVLEKGSTDNTFQVKIKDTNKFLTLYSGYLETQPASGNDFTIDGKDLVLSVPGNRGFVVCPSDGNTVKYSSDNCEDPVGINLFLAKA